MYIYTWLSHFPPSQTHSITNYIPLLTYLPNHNLSTNTPSIGLKKRKRKGLLNLLRFRVLLRVGFWGGLVGAGACLGCMGMFGCVYICLMIYMPYDRSLSFSPLDSCTHSLIHTLTHTHNSHSSPPPLYLITNYTYIYVITTHTIYIYVITTPW